MVKNLLVVLSILLLITSMALWVVLPDFLTLNLSVTGLFLISCIFSAYFFQKDLKELSHRIRTRYQKEVSTCLLVFSISALLAFLSFEYNHQFDLTKERANTLSDKTLKIINEVQAPLVIDFYTRREYWKNWKRFFTLFNEENKLIETQFKDIETLFAETQAKSISQENTAIFHYQGRTVKAQLNDELSVSNALLKIIGLKSEVFSFLTGHGELNLGDKSKNGLSFFSDLLSKEGHTVETLNLSSIEKINIENVLVVAHLKNPLLASELEKIKDFIANGGRFLFLQGISFQGKGYKSLNEILKLFGASFENKMVIDRLATVKGGDPSLPVLDDYKISHPILQGFKDRLYFPLSGSIKLQDESIAKVLLKTANFPATWAESELKEVLAGNAKYDLRDSAGPINLGITIEKGMNRGLFIGSHFLISNQYQDHAPQFNFILNGIDWLIGQEKMTSLNRPTLKLSRVYLSELHLNVVFFGSIVIGPLMLLLMAFFLFYRRRTL